MKKRFLKTVAMSAAVLAAGIGLTGCVGDKPKPTTATEITITETVTPSTSTTTETHEVLDQNATYDSITKTLKLTKTFDENSKFKVNGIEEATLTKATDGDTATFRCKHSGESVTIRFYSCDTPESTGSVEKWGKSASKFTAAKLNDAAAILLEGSQTPPVVDSYGQRYLAYVWYKETEDSDWKNLNLELVENGYSENKAQLGDEYYSKFEEAYRFAYNGSLHLWGNAEDPNYSEDAAILTVKELSESFADYKEQKVRISGYLTFVEVSGSGTYLWQCSDFDEDGNVYTVNVYSGYNSSNASKYLRVGSRYTMTGFVQTYNGAYQVSGVEYVAYSTNPDHIKRENKTYYIEFNSNKEFKTTIETGCLYQNAVVETASVTNNVLTITAKAVNTYKKENGNAEETTFTFTCKLLSTVDATSLVGRTFSTKGIQKVEKSNTIEVLRYSDFKFI